MPDGTDVEFTSPLASPFAYKVNALVTGALVDEIQRAQQVRLAIHEIESDEHDHEA